MIIIDTREQHADRIADMMRKEKREVTTTKLDNYMDYFVLGKEGTAGVQRKTAGEVFQQMEEIKRRLPEISEVADATFLLVEETFSVSQAGWLVRVGASFNDPSISASAYYNFLQSVRNSGVHVVGTRDTMESVWWLMSLEDHLNSAHIPKGKSQFTTEQQALSMACCISGVGETRALDMLDKYSIAELSLMPQEELERVVGRKSLAGQLYKALHCKVTKHRGTPV
jgi:ERCC4-type nuclease